MNKHEKINYVELPAKDFQATKTFFSEAFDWSFADYGIEYIAFSNEGLDGFYRAYKMLTKPWREIVYPSGQNYFSSQSLFEK